MAEHRSGAPRLRLLQGTLLFLCWKGAARREGDGEELVLMRDATLSELSSRLLEAPPRTLMASASEEPVSVEMGLVLVEPAMFTSLFSRDEMLAKDPWLPPLPGCPLWPSSRPSRVYRCSEGGGWQLGCW